MSNSYGDQLVLTQSTDAEGEKSIMLQKSWLNILDESTGSYNSSQSIFNTAQLATSNHWINYREAYLTVPLIITATNGEIGVDGFITAPETPATSADYLVGLKNSYLSLIHSISVDLNGRNVIQQTPYCALYNNFQLMTSMSYSDIITQGSTIGFYPDTATSYTYQSAISVDGLGICNNDISQSIESSTASLNSYATSNTGLFKRISYINYDVESTTGPDAGGEFSALQTGTFADQLYRSRVFNKINGVDADDDPPVVGKASVYQVQVMAIIKLRHLHNLFNTLPLSKGLQFKIILNINQSVVKLETDGTNQLTQTNQFLAYSGINPLMITSLRPGNNTAFAAGDNVSPIFTNPASGSVSNSKSCLVSLYVGNKCLNSTQTAVAGVKTSALPNTLQLYAPAYEMNPVVESMYLQNPNKTIIYNDIYQYRITNIPKQKQFNQLITQGITGIKSILVIPIFNGAGGTDGMKNGDPLQSVFDPCGGGTTAPLSHITNFQVRVGGMNQIYTTQRYNFEAYNNNLYGANSINAGLTDGLASGLIDEQAFNHSYCYYWVDCARGLPIESTIPKSVTIEGLNTSNFDMDYYVFIEYQNQISVNVLSGILL